MRTKRLSTVVLATFVLLLALPAHALIIRGDFAGTIIKDPFVEDGSYVQFPLIEVGMPFTGYFQYDSDDPLGGLPVSANAIMDWTIGPWEFTWNGGQGSNSTDIYVTNDSTSSGFDQIEFYGGEFDNSFGFPDLWAEDNGLLFRDDDGTALDALVLPSSFPDLSEFEVAILYAVGDYWIEGDPLCASAESVCPYRFRGQIESLKINIVPEPSTALLLVTGLVGLAARRKHSVRHVGCGRARNLSALRINTSTGL